MEFFTENDNQIQSGVSLSEGAREDRSAPVFWFGIRRSAAIETLAFLSFAVLLDALFGNGTRFVAATPHPFWIVVLLVIVQYGPREAVFAALLAGAFLLVGNMPEQSLTETTYDYAYRVFFQPLLWVVAALLLGGIRARQLEEREELFERLGKSEESTRIFASGCSALKKAKERLELRLAQERRGVLTVYQVARAAHNADYETLTDNIGRIVTVALNPKKFSIYWQEGDALALGRSFGWDRDDAYLRRFEKNSPLARAMTKKRRMLSVVGEDDEKLLDRQGAMAGPIVDEKTGRLLGMLKIEDMEFIDINANAHETFRVVCEWIALACACAARQRELPGDEIRVPGMEWIRNGAALSATIFPIPDLFPKVPSELTERLSHVTK